MGRTHLPVVVAVLMYCGSILIGVQCQEENIRIDLTSEKSNHPTSEGSVDKYESITETTTFSAAEENIKDVDTQNLNSESSESTSSTTTETNVIRNSEGCPRASKGDVELLKAYSEKCPDSATDVWPTKQPDGYMMSDKDKLELHLQNKLLISRVIEEGCYGEEVLVPFHLPNHAFELLDVSINIYGKLCPTVSKDFLSNIYSLFHYLHWMTSSEGRTEIIRDVHYKWMLKLLGKCLTKAKPLFAPQIDSCKVLLLGADNCSNFICTRSKYEFNLHRTDPLVDAMWKVYELIHSACFSSFKESYRMFHKFAQTIMDVWSQEIKLRWINQQEDTEYWKRVLGPNYETNLLNMERCNQATINRTIMPYRLPRHSIAYRPRLHGDPGIIPVCRPDNKKAHIQFALVQDATGSYIQFLDTLSSIMPQFLKALTDEFPQMEFALTSFMDYLYLPLHSMDDFIDYCYKLEEPFSSDNEIITKGIKKVKIERNSGGDDGPEVSLTGILYTAGDPNIGWATKSYINGKKVYKVIAVTTDERWKSKDVPAVEDAKAEWIPNSTLPEPTGDGSDTCDMYPPDAIVVRDVLEKKNIHLLGLVSPSIMSTWEGYFEKYEFKKERAKLIQLDGSQAQELAKNLIKEFSEIVRIDQCGI